MAGTHDGNVKKSSFSRPAAKPLRLRPELMMVPRPPHQPSINEAGNHFELQRSIERHAINKATRSKADSAQPDEKTINPTKSYGDGKAPFTSPICLLVRGPD
jgi:hypothetical protein